MLKRLLKRRLFLTFGALLILVSMLGMPLHRQYSTYEDLSQCTTCGRTYNVTNVDYGFPFSWLTLHVVERYNYQKGTIINTDEATVTNKAKLSFNVLVWGLGMTIAFACSRLYNRRRYAHLGN